MSRQIAWILLFAIVGSVRPALASLCEPQRPDAAQKPAATAPQPEGPPRFKWWLHPESKKELGLTEKQSRKIDEIWESTAPKQRDKYHELEKLEEALAATIKESTADEKTVAQQVERVEKLRAETAATRIVMIYKMYQLLTPEQRIKVDAIRARLDAERKQRDEERRRQGRIPKF
jgi:Spy/CpxP family protein refolding chaperone